MMRGPSSKNGVTWPRFVRAAIAFCPVSSQKWSVLFSMFYLSPLHHVLNWQVFTLIFAVLLPTFTLYCKFRRDLTTPTLGVISHALANTCCTKYEVSIFNCSKDINGFQILQKGHMTMTIYAHFEEFFSYTKNKFAHKLRTVLLYSFKRYWGDPKF